MPLIRSVALHVFGPVVTELGGDPEDLAARAGLPPGALDSTDLLLCDTHVAIALELAAEELSCPDFGLRMAARQDLSVLGPLGLAIKHSPTLAAAVSHLNHYLFVHAEGLKIEVIPDPLGTPHVSGVAFGAGPGRVPPPQSTALMLGFAHRAAMQLVGGPYGLRSVELPHEPPDPAAYRAYFRGPVNGDRGVAAIRVTGSLAGMAVRGHDEELQRLAVAMLARHRRTPADDIIQVVRTSLAQAMGTSPLTIAAVARHLNVHPRTLQRLLEASGTNFAQVLDDLRRHTARHLLTSTDLPVAQVAHKVGYTEAATLTRRARGWWGMTPMAVRNPPSES